MVQEPESLEWFQCQFFLSIFLPIPHQFRVFLNDRIAYASPKYVCTGGLFQSQLGQRDLKDGLSFQ